MTDIALLPCPHCGGKEHEIGVGGAGHSVTCHSVSCRASTGLWHTREQAIAAWNRRSSPSQVAPANPAQVTDALDAAELDMIRHGDMLGRALGARVYAALAAIGAGGQAVAWRYKFRASDPTWTVSNDKPSGAIIEPLYTHPTDERVVEALETYYARQIEWSKQTFGPALRTGGVIDHIRKELKEIEADPHDLSEWVDVIILAMDGFWRHGGTVADLMPRLLAKQQKNMARIWPDWRTMSENRAIEHDRSGEAALSQKEGR